MVRSWLIVACVAGCTDDDAHTQWFDSGSYVADYAPVGGGEVHVDYLDNIMYLAWESPARLHAIHLCDEHQVSIPVPQSASAGDAIELIGVEVTIDAGLCQIGAHQIRSAVALAVRSTDAAIVEPTAWSVTGTLQIDSYAQHPDAASAAAPGGTPEEMIAGTFDLELTDPTSRTGRLANGTFDFGTSSFTTDTNPFE